MFQDNLILLSDGYKFTHWKQYPAGTEHVYSYLEARGGTSSYTVFFGLQYYLKKFLAGVRITAEMVDEADVLSERYFGSDQFNRAMWDRIVYTHGGKLPLIIKAVPEGTLVPCGNVLMTVENTDPACFALTNWVETLLMKVWYPITVATTSWEARNILEFFAKSTCDDGGHIPWQLHDFGYRGVSSEESAAIGGAAHLLSFNGTDTIAGITMLNKFYSADCNGPLAFAGSVPAAEHSTITSWGREHEADAYRNMLESYPTGVVSVVSDSYDILNACEEIWGKELKDQVLTRDGILVIRPDSGDAVSLIPRLLETLGRAFGTTPNEKGFKVLNPKVRLIQGDGINLNTLEDILVAMEAYGWASENLVFGMGGGLLQKCDRDTHSFAFKCSSIQVNGEQRDVYKDPAGDSAKRSKRGRLVLLEKDGRFTTEETTRVNLQYDKLRVVFANGELYDVDGLISIRDRLASQVLA